MERSYRLAFLICSLSIGLACHITHAAPSGCFFIPGNGSMDGTAGKSHVSFDTTRGGAISLVTGERPTLTETLRLNMRFKVQLSNSGIAEINQENDRSPEMIIIEEGNQRAGLRVNFKLYDKSQRYFGHGMTETWLYPNGEIFVTAAASFEGMMPNHGASDTNLISVGKANGPMIVSGPRAEGEAVTEAAIHIGLQPGMRAYLPGSGAIKDAIRFDDPAMASHAINLGNDQKVVAALYWLTGKNEYHNIIYRTEGGAPTYYRWPIYLIQAFGGDRLSDVKTAEDAIELRWLTGTPAAKPNPSFVAVFRIIAPDNAATAPALAAAESKRIALTVDGGNLQGNPDSYNDLEGVYEIRKTNNPVKVTIPAGEPGQTVRLKVIGLSGHGAVAAKLDGHVVIPHLAGEGGIADDPLAPIREQPEGPADMALLTVQLGSKPQILEVTEAPGVQLAYQTRDRWRSVACYSTKGGWRYPGFRFSLVDGRARNMRAYGQRDWALTENLLTWFSYCGFTPEQMIDQLTNFEVLKNGPDAAEFRYVSRNVNQQVQSEFRVGIPADSPAMQMNVAATFTVLESWPYNSCQFFDVFPFRGVWPDDWWYDSVLWLAPDGRWKTMDTKARTYDGDKDLQQITGGGFFAMYSADRGNMLMLTKNFQPALPVEYVICGNYIDFHMTTFFPGPDGKPTVPSKGFTASMQYDLAIWGNGKTTRDQLIEIGKKSIKAGRLVLPK